MAAFVVEIQLLLICQFICRSVGLSVGLPLGLPICLPISSTIMRELISWIRTHSLSICNGCQAYLKQPSSRCCSAYALAPHVSSQPASSLASQSTNHKNALVTCGIPLSHSVLLAAVQRLSTPPKLQACPNRVLLAQGYRFALNLPPMSMPQEKSRKSL
jgi:hypothetical protein